MNIRLLVIPFFFLHLWLLIFGYDVWGRYTNPYLILGATVCIAGLYFYSIIGDEKKRLYRERPTTPVNLLFLSLSAVLLCTSFVYLCRVFAANPDVHTWSDVIPQLEDLYDRFARGEQPYYPLPEYGHHPFPVYMPLHWLPVGIGRWGGIDSRIVGMTMLYIVTCPLIFLTMTSVRSYRAKGWVSIAPAMILPVFCQKSVIDVTMNLESIIAAYYLILAIGLWQRNIWITTAGIILCVLSRYTLVFWLPLFAIVMWVSLPRSQSIMLWVSVVTAVILIYIVPFIIPAPHIFLDGIRYHNGAAEEEWKYMGTFENGLYFAQHMRDLFPGTMAHRVYLARIVQASFMLSLLAGGLAAYRRVRDRVDPYDFCLGMLYLTLSFFYLFGPLTYRYYLITVCFQSVVLCIRILSAKELTTRAIGGNL